MSKSDAEVHQQSVNRFIELANEIAGEGANRDVVSAAMMSASSVYATFVAAGNAGVLNPSGVDKVVTAYKQRLEQVQSARRAELEAEGKA